MGNQTKSLILLCLAALVLSGCVAQTSTGLAQRAMDAVAPSPGNLVEITPLPEPSDTPVLDIEPSPAPSFEPLPPAKPSAEPTPEPTLAPSPTPEYDLTDVKDVAGYVGAASVNLRAGPGTNYKVIGEFEGNTLLTITAKNEEWYYVEVEGETGFMFKEYVGVGAIPTPTPTPKATPKSTPKATVKPSATATPTAQPAATPTPSATPKPAEANNSGAGSYSAEEVLLTAQIAYEESKRGDYDGYRAVANVVLNRVKSGIFRSTVEGVIFQGNGSQFSPAKNEAALRAVVPSGTCIEAVQAVFGGDTLFGSDVYYFRPASKGESWGSHNYIATYGGNAYFS